MSFQRHRQQTAFELGSCAITTRLTPRVASAIATIGVMGHKASEIVARLAGLDNARLQVGNICFAKWSLGEHREHVVVCRTADDSVEVHCHGGIAVSDAILTQLQESGCQLVRPEDWRLATSDRECLALTQVQAEEDLLRATAYKPAAILLDQRSGALHETLMHINLCLVNSDHKTAEHMIDQLLDWASLGSHLTSPWRVVLAGPPNVGKSSLINALAGRREAIVHHEPGTTRDWIESSTQVDAWPLIIADTAGLRETGDAIEAEGVLRAKKQIDRADLLIITVDGTVGWNSVHDQLLQSRSVLKSKPSTCIVCTKADLSETQHADSSLLTGLRDIAGQHGLLLLSTAIDPARDLKLGIDALLDWIRKALMDSEPAPGQAIPFRQSHIEVLSQLKHALTSEPLDAKALQVAQQMLSPMIASGLH